LERSVIIFRLGRIVKHKYLKFESPAGFAARRRQMSLIEISDDTRVRYFTLRGASVRHQARGKRSETFSKKCLHFFEF